MYSALLFFWFFDFQPSGYNSESENRPTLITCNSCFAHRLRITCTTNDQPDSSGHSTGHIWTVAHHAVKHNDFSCLKGVTYRHYTVLLRFLRFFTLWMTLTCVINRVIIIIIIIINWYVLSHWYCFIVFQLYFAQLTNELTWLNKTVTALCKATVLCSLTSNDTHRCCPAINSAYKFTKSATLFWNDQ